MKRLIFYGLLFLIADNALRFWLLAHTPRTVMPGFDLVSWSMTDSGYFKTDDVTSERYNVRNGERRVDGQPAQFRHTVWLFGNSGLFDPWLSDAESAASLLQRRLPGYRVVNRAASAQVILGEIAYLRETPVLPGDIVVFVDGWTDAKVSRERSDPQLCAAEPQYQISVLVAAVLCGFLPLADMSRPVADYNQRVALAERVARARGAAFWHFLQPGQTPLLRGMSGIPIIVPAADFNDGAHMNARGAAIEARAIYDQLSIY